MVPGTEPTTQIIKGDMATGVNAMICVCDIHCFCRGENRTRAKAIPRGQGHHQQNGKRETPPSSSVAKITKDYTTNRLLQPYPCRTHCQDAKAR